MVVVPTNHKNESQIKTIHRAENYLIVNSDLHNKRAVEHKHIEVYSDRSRRFEPHLMRSLRISTRKNCEISNN